MVTQLEPTPALKKEKHAAQLTRRFMVRNGIWAGKNRKGFAVWAFQSIAKKLLCVV
jgi:hypothetical protein